MDVPEMVKDMNVNNPTFVYYKEEIEGAVNCLDK